MLVDYGGRKSRRIVLGTSTFEAWNKWKEARFRGEHRDVFHFCFALSVRVIQASKTLTQVDPLRLDFLSVTRPEFMCVGWCYVVAQSRPPRRRAHVRKARNWSTFISWEYNIPVTSKTLISSGQCPFSCDVWLFFVRYALNLCHYSLGRSKNFYVIRNAELKKAQNASLTELFYDPKNRRCFHLLSWKINICLTLEVSKW